MKQIKSNRIGKFEVSIELINQFPESLKTVMSECIVIGVDMLNYYGKVVCTAVSARFDKIKEGDKIPEYIWELNTKDGKDYITSCRRLKDVEEDIDMEDL